MSERNAEAYWGERAYETLVENATEIIARFDRAHRHLYVNRAVTRATGRPAAEFVGRTNAELGMPAELVAAWDRAIERVFEHATEETIEFPFPDPTGRMRWYRSRMVPEFAADGSVESLVAVSRDVTEVKEAEARRIAEARHEAEAAAAHRDLLASAIQATDVCIAVMTGYDLRFTIVNPAFQLLAPESAMLGQRYGEIFPEAAAAGAEERLRAVLDTGITWKLERYRAPVPGQPDAVWEGEAVRLAPGRAGDEPSVGVFVQNVTGRARIEQQLALADEALRAANAKLESTLDSVTDGTVVVDRNWRCVYISARASSILGTDARDLLWQNIWEFYPHAVGTKFHENYHRAFETGQPVHFEEYYPEPLHQWIECHAYPDGNELTVYFRDITDRKEAEAVLHESTALLRAISDTSPDVIFAKDLEGRITFANPATLRLIGRTAEEVLGRTDAEFLADKVAARQVMENDQRIMRSGEPAELEEMVPYPDGTECIWLSRKIPFRDADGRVIGLLGISRDITERKRAEEEVRAARTSLKRILDSITDGLAVLDRNWRYTYFSETGAKMLGLRADEFIGRSVWELFPHADDLLFGVEYRRAMETGQPTHFEEFYPEPLNTWLECHCYPSADGLSVYFREVNDRKRIEAEKAALLENEKRLRAQAEEAIETKDRLLAAVSHELRNPLTAMSGWLQVLEAGADQELHELALKSMSASLASQRRLVDDLLDAVRFSHGNVVLVREVVDLGAIAGEVCATLHPVALEHEIALHLDLESAPVYGDRGRIAQIVANLLSNALKFTPRGGTIIMRVRSTADRAILSVEDNGYGIAPEFIPKLFERFTQEGTHSSKGLGLGLSIVRDIVQLHDGTIRASSAGIGKGALFTVELPRHGNS